MIIPYLLFGLAYILYIGRQTEVIQDNFANVFLICLLSWIFWPAVFTWRFLQFLKYSLTSHKEHIEWQSKH